MYVHTHDINKPLSCCYNQRLLLFPTCAISFATTVQLSLLENLSMHAKNQKNTRVQSQQHITDAKSGSECERERGWPKAY